MVDLNTQYEEMEANYKEIFIEAAEMIRAAMGGEEFRWPAGRYVSFKGFDHIMMAVEATITAKGCAYEETVGTPEEMAALRESYKHLCALRDEVIAMGVLPPVAEWHALNNNIDE